MYFRSYGPDVAPTVIVLHGGPGAPGSAAGLARAIADPWRVLEPWQRGDSVAAHVSDLRSFADEHCSRPVLVGHSWGAMLALAYAAIHPVRAIAMVCSGTWDLASRGEFERLLAAGVRYDVDPLADEGASEFDRHECEVTWADMVRLQGEGVYPAAFAAIHAPVVMLHGADDPHPGAMIRDSLRPYLPQLEYSEIPRCGHYPWRERHARDDFIARLRDWLTTSHAST